MKSAPAKDSLESPALGIRDREGAWAGAPEPANAGAPGPSVSAQTIGEKFRSLSRREAEVCSLVARRLSTAEIATCLFISPRTVEKHVEIIFDKLDARSREQLRWRLGVLPSVGRDAT